ncbi:MAG TPA: transcription termination/antitermination protein NusA, partial [Dehalococcoidia bacterium]|nr:transcription termination/antitermination protein NusA [Dehalococcoidia bacterium]
HYRPGQRQKFYLLEVHRSLKGPQLILSRTHKNLLRRLFELEVPEIHKGVVEIRSIAREAGYRSKVAVTARQEGVDPVGSCVGLRGIRIQNIVNELNGERIDVVQWDQDAARFVANALSPAQVLNVTVSEETNTASVVVPDRQLSLAIGREGQNARLAAKLTGWRIDIKPESAMQEVLAAAPAAAKPAAAAPATAVAPPGEREAQPWMEAIEGEEAEAAPAIAEPVAEALEAPAVAESTVEAAAGGIRFAEEVLTPPPDSGDGKKRKKAKKVERKPEETEAKAKKTKRTRRPVIVEEDDEEDGDDFEEFKA